MLKRSVRELLRLGFYSKSVQGIRIQTLMNFFPPFGYYKSFYTIDYICLKTMNLYTYIKTYFKKIFRKVYFRLFSLFFLINAVKLIISKLECITSTYCIIPNFFAEHHIRGGSNVFFL